MTIDELVQANANISTAAAGRFAAQFQGLEDELYSRLIKLLRRFDTKSGKFDPAGSKTVLLEVKQVLGRIMSNERLREAVRELLPQFDAIAQNVEFMHGEESGIVVQRKLTTDAKHRMIDLTVDTVVEGGYDARFVLPVKKVLYNHVNFGAEVLEAERALRSLIKGEPGKGGVLQQYAGQVARDALNQYEGQVHKEIADQYELTSYRYVGNIIGTTRPQCRRWVKMQVITAEQLPDEIAWMRRNGSGWIPGTTPTTWPIYRGGYNCLHSAIPTRRKP